MSIVDRIRANGGEVVRDEWRMRVSRGRLSDEAFAWVRAHIRDVAREVWPAFDEWDERAAIREYDGGQDRSTAEREAYREVSGC